MNGKQKSGEGSLILAGVSGLVLLIAVFDILFGPFETPIPDSGALSFILPLMIVFLIGLVAVVVNQLSVEHTNGTH